MSEVKIGAHDYSIGRLNAFQQFHVARRIAPLVTSMLENPEELKRSREAVIALLRKVISNLADLSDENTNYVLTTCLSAVQRKRAQNGGWDKLTAPGGALMFPTEIDMVTMLELVWHVIVENLASFFDALPSTSNGAPGGAPSVISSLFLTRKIG